MDVLNDIIIVEKPAEIFYDTVSLKERFTGTYREYGEKLINTKFDLLKSTRKGKTTWEELEAKGLARKKFTPEENRDRRKHTNKYKRYI